MRTPTFDPPEAESVNLTRELEPQPTLALFLGGTGVLTGKMLLKMLENVPEQRRGDVETFFIDSQAPDIAYHERSRHYCYRNLSRFEEPVYEEFREQRMPSNLGREPVMDSSDGCGITRIFGSASLAECRDDFTRKLLSGAVRRLRQRRSDTTQPLQIYLTASACGGTGAGMLIDAAALIRHHLAEQFHERPRIYAFLIGPEAFDGMVENDEQKERMMASAYAMMKELHHFADGAPFRSGYRLRDKPIEIRNDASGDRLFEWVFYVDGKTEAGAVVRSREELCSIVAELQLHFALSLVGRKIRESIPNLREQRARQYPADFVHPESREGRPREEEAALRRASRRCFLASLSVRNVRFPGPEIADYERARWTSKAIGALLERPEPEDAETLQIMDRLLGVEAGKITGEGLLGRLGVTSGALRGRVVLSGWVAPNRRTDPLRIHGQGQTLLDGARDLLAVRAVGAATSSDRGSKAAFSSWKHEWRENLEQRDQLPQYLFELAGDATSGRGLRWLQRFVDHVIAFLEKPRAVAALEEDWQELEVLRQAALHKHGRLARALRKDEKNLLLRARRGFRKLTNDGAKTLVGPDTIRRAETAVDPLAQLATAAAALEQKISLPDLERLAYRQVADDLKTWRREKLDPVLDVLTAAQIDAAARLRRREVLLKNPPGEAEGARLSVRSLVDENLLETLRAQAASRPSMIDLVVRPFFASGLVQGQARLSIDTVHGIHDDGVVEVVERTVARATRSQLASLRLGWQLPAARARLAEAAALLDGGAKPLISYTEAAVGLSPLRYLIRPDGLDLGNPFGQSFEGAEQFVGQDRMQLTVVTVALGIPPNTLVGIERWFRQYCLHLGDDQNICQLDRFPLHVFRGAAGAFDEPYSPLDLCRHPDYLEGLKDLLRCTEWDDGITLEIRPSIDLTAYFEEPDDCNVVIELTDRIVRAARHRPSLRQRIVKDPKLTPLARRLSVGPYSAHSDSTQRDNSFETAYGGNGNAQN